MIQIKTFKLEQITDSYNIWTKSVQSFRSSSRTYLSICERNIALNWLLEVLRSILTCKYIKILVLDYRIILIYIISEVISCTVMSYMFNEICVPFREVNALCTVLITNVTAFWPWTRGPTKCNECPNARTSHSSLFPATGVNAGLSN